MIVNKSILPYLIEFNCHNQGVNLFMKKLKSYLVVLLS
jgi:hypothetical protein